MSYIASPQAWVLGQWGRCWGWVLRFCLCIWLFVFPGSYEFIQLGCDAGVSEVGGQVEYFVLRIQLQLNTALLSTVRVFVTGVTSHNSHIYKGINAMLNIRGPIKPCIFWIKIILAIFLAKTRPDKTIFSALTNLTIDFDFELSKI